MDNSVKEKIVLLLMAGVALGFSRSAFQHYRIYKAVGKEWQKINRQKLEKEIQNLYRSKLVKEKKNPDGSFTFVLSDKGKLKALTYHFSEIKIKKQDWDKKWRVVFFDIPEKYRWGRDALRRKLKELGFYELQKSVFVFPYHCEDEIDFIIEYYGIRKHVRYGVFDYIDNDLHLKENFKLN
ncbi:MAG: hypothetical protein A3F47_01135 [Candidatus Staskawiczbacteria bacterium RIFCSPHIGHO2_12_FULL_38_11]|uniref:Transcriptional repressor PaaX-like central Cas2-like domain-containing protein n=1 Tax=Candidatus Staskawiczbacteria bacterium RIFCSPHIGHO2_12_FULL_38_11 TaxID=1802209 RepID=A0A1G2I511_9BACT|nr:MAG: hypothetical protein A3F47_01135 [Candidatus Staskawiczbacteria bacterium RIFCSPHIGHO2_12_FULL_38_11]